MTASDRSRRPAGCPSDLQLEELAAGDFDGDPEGGRLQDHLKGCERCRDRVAALASEPSLIPDELAWRSILATLPGAAPAARATARGPHRRWIGGALTAGAIAAATLLVWTRRDRLPVPGADTRVKGSLALTVYVKRARTARTAAAGGVSDQVEQIEGEGSLRAGDEMRFALAGSGGGYPVVIGLDAAPSVSVYSPRAGAPAASARAVVAGERVALEGSVIADAAAGVEKIFGLICPQAPASVDELKRRAEAALRAAGGHPEQVLTLGSGCLEGAVLLRKLPPVR